MSKYRVMVTKYGFATIDADNELEATEIADGYPDHYFDWGELGGAEVIDDED